jgi:predicted amidohydrolase YtcJ
VPEGHHPSASSDGPVYTVDPFENLYTIMTRKHQQRPVTQELGATIGPTLELMATCLTTATM